MHTITVTRSYLQLSSPLSTGAEPLPDGVRIVHAHPCPIALFRHLYAEVGRDYRWRDRLDWTDEQCAEHLSRPEVSIWVLEVDGAAAGYFELSAESDGSVEIAYLGLMPAFIGRGFGKKLLSIAAERAWAIGATRVWLHTCSLDNPSALPNYLARGFEKYREEHFEIPA